MSGYREVEQAPVVVTAFGAKVFGLDRRTGRVLWEEAIQLGGSMVALAITPTAIFAATSYVLTCLRYPDGAVVWAVASAVMGGRPSLVVDGDRIFVAKSGEVECFSTDGQPIWHERFKGKGVGEAALGVPGNVVQADERG